MSIFGRLRASSRTFVPMAEPMASKNEPVFQPAPSSHAPKSAPSSHAPGTQIGYHPELIHKFEAHHASLRKLMASVKEHAANDEFAAALKSLQAFRRGLTTHVLEENIKLYTYLERCLDRDPTSKEFVRSMTLEMGAIGNTVLHFVNKYTRTGITPFNKKQFLAELADVDEVFSTRLEQEESSLYSMYLPPEAFS